MTPRQVDELLDLLEALLRNTEAIARQLGDDGDRGVGLRAVPGNEKRDPQTDHGPLRRLGERL